MISMTGFASCSVSLINEKSQSVVFWCILKSINSRYFELTCKLPCSLQALETDILHRLRTQLLRGKCNLIIQCSDPAMLKQPVEPSLIAVKNYLKAAQHIQEFCDVPGMLTIADIMCIPELLVSHDRIIDESFKAQLYTALDDLVQQLMHSRIAEGQALQIDILERCAVIDEAFKTLSAKAQNNFSERYAKLVDQLALLESNKEADIIKHQLTHECNRSDVTEELVRFKTHFESLQTMITAQNTQKGRHLDFIIQELGREINTIASKSSDALISSLVISVKVELEKIREQVQNII